MVKFACVKCKFRFSPRNSANTKPPARCPYCSREGTIITERSADDLVRDVDEIVGD